MDKTIMRRRKSPRQLQGFTLIEVALLMVFIGMLAYIVARPLYQEHFRRPTVLSQQQ